MTARSIPKTGDECILLNDQASKKDTLEQVRYNDQENVHALLRFHGKPD